MEPLGGSKPLRAACRPATRQRKRLHSCSDTESCCPADPVPPLLKRTRRRAPGGSTVGGEPSGTDVAATAAAVAPDTPTAADCPAEGLCPYELSLFVRWHAEGGGVRVNRLRLNPFSSINELRGLSRRLVKSAFSEAASLPDYLVCPEWYKFSPAEQLVSLPGDIARTEFRLAVTLEGWEFTLCERTLPGTPDPERKLLVTLAEFESDAVTVSDRQYVARLLSYPTVCVKRAFLDAAVAALREGRAPGGCGAASSSSGGGGSGSASDGACEEGEEEEEAVGEACSRPPSPSLSSA